MRISDWSSDVCSSDLIRGNSLSVSQRSRGFTAFGVSIPSIGLILMSPRLTAQRNSRRATANTFRRLAICRSEEHTSELQSLMRISYAVFCLKKKKTHTKQESHITTHYRSQDHKDVNNTRT